MGARAAACGDESGIGYKSFARDVVLAMCYGPWGFQGLRVGWEQAQGGRVYTMGKGGASRSQPACMLRAMQRDRGQQWLAHYKGRTRRAALGEACLEYRGHAAREAWAGAHLHHPTAVAVRMGLSPATPQQNRPRRTKQTHEAAAAHLHHLHDLREDGADARDVRELHARQPLLARSALRPVGRRHPGQRVRECVCVCV